jgi:hypothetical protein
LKEVGGVIPKKVTLKEKLVMMEEAIRNEMEYLEEKKAKKSVLGKRKTTF